MSPAAPSSDLSGVHLKHIPQSLNAWQARLFLSRLSFQGKQVTLGDWNHRSSAGTHPGGQTPVADARSLGDLSRPLLPVGRGRAGVEPAELGWLRGFPPVRSADHC